jgi:thymidine kinase
MAKLYFYYSAMNAGKSTALLQASYNYQERGMQTLLFAPVIDDRNKSGRIFSRISLEAEANLFTAKDNLLEHVEKFLKEQAELKCIFIDEAQFLTKAQVLQLTAIVDRLNIPVYVMAYVAIFVPNLLKEVSIY